MQRIPSALSDPPRRTALVLLSEAVRGAEFRPCDLVARLEVSRRRISRHMKVLREAGPGRWRGRLVMAEPGL